MANGNGREALRGAEEETFDFLAEVLTPEQWAEMLRAPLKRAARQGNRGLAQKLVEAGAKIGDALHDAIWGDNEDVVNDLLENGASVAAESACGYHPLHYAAMFGASQMVQLLLLKGAEKDAMSKYGDTPLFLALEFDHLAAALALMAAGADVSMVGGAWKASALHQAADLGHVSIMTTAIERGADVNAVDTVGRTPLIWAAINNKAEAIDVLVEAGADIEASEHSGNTPLSYAAFFVKLEALSALLKHGADVNAQNFAAGQTPLHAAATKAGTHMAAEVLDSLLRSGADETTLDDEGRAAADVVGIFAEEEEQVADDVERVRQLLANAPADRVWRRRGYLALCRAHPDRMQLLQAISSAPAGVAWRTRSRAKLGRTEVGSSSGSTMADGRNGGDWAGLVAGVLMLQEEGIFRTIVGYL